MERRETGGWSSTGGGEARAATMAAAVVWMPIWTGSGSIELEKGWWSFGALLGRSGREGLKRSGEVRPEGRRRRALLVSAPREHEEREGDGTEKHPGS